MNLKTAINTAEIDFEAPAHLLHGRHGHLAAVCHLAHERRVHGGGVALEDGLLLWRERPRHRAQAAQGWLWTAAVPAVAVGTVVLGAAVASAIPAASAVVAVVTQLDDVDVHAGLAQQLLHVRVGDDDADGPGHCCGVGDNPVGLRRNIVALKGKRKRKRIEWHWVMLSWCVGRKKVGEPQNKGVRIRARRFKKLFFHCDFVSPPEAATGPIDTTTGLLLSLSVRTMCRMEAEATAEPPGLLTRSTTALAWKKRLLSLFRV